MTENLGSFYIFYYKNFYDEHIHKTIHYLKSSCMYIGKTIYIYTEVSPYFFSVRRVKVKF